MPHTDTGGNKNKNNTIYGIIETKESVMLGLWGNLLSSLFLIREGVDDLVNCTYHNFWLNVKLPRPSSLCNHKSNQMITYHF